MSVIDDEVRKARQKLVLDHIHDEGRQEWDEVLSTFPHPYYELVGTMTVYDGADAVRDYWRFSRTAFPDQDHELISLRHSEDAVIVEFWLFGTHLGPLGAIPPTGNRFRVRMSVYFVFDADENLVSERVYFDSLTMLKQLIGGLNLKNPKNWPLLLRCLRGMVRTAGADPDPRLLNTTAPVLSE
jgi:predicted ester cyclase